MIRADRLRDLMLTLKADLSLIEDLDGVTIDDILIAASETQIVKRISNKVGIILVAKLPAATASIVTADNFSEDNECLIMLLEKQEPASMTDSSELLHFAKMQKLMSEVKNWILEHGLNSGDNENPETLSKAFRTEYEYQVFGNFNGLSVSFNFKDFEL